MFETVTPYLLPLLYNQMYCGNDSSWIFTFNNFICVYEYILVPRRHGITENAVEWHNEKFKVNKI